MTRGSRNQDFQAFRVCAGMLRGHRSLCLLATEEAPAAAAASDAAAVPPPLFQIQRIVNYASQAFMGTKKA